MTAPLFDELIHQPHRLRICVLLSTVEHMSFQALCEDVDVSMPTLSKQLKMLSEAGYVATSKTSGPGRSTTRASLTQAGRRALTGHLDALRELAAQAGQA